MDRKYITDIADFEPISSSVEEQETTIVIERVLDRAKIFTSDNTELTRLKRVFAASNGEWQCWEGTRNSKGEITGYFFSCPKTLVRYHRAITLSAEQQSLKFKRMSDLRARKLDKRKV